MLEEQDSWTVIYVELIKMRDKRSFFVQLVAASKVVGQHSLPTSQVVRLVSRS